MNDIAEQRLIDGDIAYFKFSKGAKPEDFLRVFPSFKAMVSDPRVSRMIVDVQMDDVWGKDIQDVWLRTGAEAQAAGIRRWAVVTGDSTKQMTIRHLIRGGRERNRSYESHVAADLEEALAWIQR